jgi:hypothetical protein
MPIMISWAHRCRLEPFKSLTNTLKKHLPGVVRGMLDGSSNAYVEAMNGLPQQAKRAARDFRTVSNFIAIVYLRMAKLKCLPTKPLAPPCRWISALRDMPPKVKFHTERHTAPICRLQR